MRRTAGLALAILAAGTPAKAQSSGDSVLILMADDLGVDMVRAYAEGTSPPPTPNLDALAASGVLFRNAWAYPVCSPSRAALMTGRHPMRTLVGTALPLGAPLRLRLREWTLPEVLDAAGSGYAHALIGKWHLGGGPAAPNDVGWSHFAGFLEGHLPDYYRWSRVENGQTSISTTYATTAQVDEALTWIGRQSGPWVCTVMFAAANSPYHAPPPHLHSQNLQGLDPKVTPGPFHAAMVEAMDREIGRLLAGLGSQRARTNVIFVADNGSAWQVTKPPFSQLKAKGTVYEGGVNVPLIVSGPAVQAPHEEAGLVSLVDVYATVLEMAGVDANAVVPPWVALDGVSMMPCLLSANPPRLRTTVFAERFNGQTFSGALLSGEAAVRDERFKLIRSFWGGNPADRLYDLWNDPWERSNLLLAPLGNIEAMRYVALQGEMQRFRQPPAGTWTYGSGQCHGSRGQPAIGAGAPAVFGTTFDVTASPAVPGAQAFLLVASPGAAWTVPPLPFSLTPLGAGPGCMLEVPFDLTVPTVVDGTGTARVPLTVPGTPEVVGETFRFQWALADPAAPNNTLGLTTSDALATVIGY